MKKNRSIQIERLFLDRRIILGMLFFVIAWFLLACFGFDPVKPSTVQEDRNLPSIREQEPDNVHLILPLFVGECIDKNVGLLAQIDIPTVSRYNPYFVRGDLDGDGNPDYVVVVEGKDDKREGLLVCFRDRDRKAVLLGLDPKNKPPFWRLAEWDIETVTEISETTDLKGKLIGIKPKGESIVMKWEDAVGIVYWDGKQFQWKQVILNDGN